jgi:Flp pilus assembly pilin Flp
VLALFIFLKTLLAARFEAMSAIPARDDSGQATAEYALVLVGAAAVAVLVSAWAKHAGGVSKLLDAVFAHVLGRVE